MADVEKGEGMIRKRSVFKITLSTLVALVLVMYLWRVSTERVDNQLVPTPSRMSVKPVPDFTDFDRVQDKKKAFFSYLKPEIELQNSHLLGVRHQLQIMLRTVQQGKTLDRKDEEQINWLAKEYRVKTRNSDNAPRSLESVIKGLLKRVDIIPVDLVLVQAANESAWGTSRFARKGYNFFGLWCFQKGCGFVPSRRNEDASHEVAKFNDLTRAVYTYLRNLNRHDAYTQLREIRAQLRENQLPITGNALAEGLTSYSERGQDYVDELQAMIRFNKEYFSE